jgi:hypothetical protein
MLKLSAVIKSWQAQVSLLFHYRPLESHIPIGIGLEQPRIPVACSIGFGHASENVPTISCLLD